MCNRVVIGMTTPVRESSLGISTIGGRTRIATTRSAPIIGSYLTTLKGILETMRMTNLA
jgi:hypothetical protein